MIAIDTNVLVYARRQARVRRRNPLQSFVLKKYIAYWHYWYEVVRPRRQGMIVFTVTRTAGSTERRRVSRQHGRGRRGQARPR